MSFLCSSACSRAAWSFRGNSDASSSIYRQLQVLQLLQMNNSGVETMLCNLLRAWLSNFWVFLVCLFLSLTHDSSFLLTLVSYCFVTHIIETFCCDRCYTTITCCHRKSGYPGMISAVPLSFFSLFLYCCPAFCIPLCLPVCLGRCVLCLSFHYFLCYFVAFFLPNVAIFLLPAFVLFPPSLLSDVVHLCIIGFFLGTDYLCVLHYFI